MSNNLLHLFQRFQENVNAEILNGFSTVAKHIHHKSCGSAYNYLVNCVALMKESIQENHVDKYFYFQHTYYKLFAKINTKLAIDLFKEGVRTYQISGSTLVQAQQYAASALWRSNPRFKKWLPVQIHIPYKLKTLIIVGDEKFAPKGSTFLTLEELEYLGNEPEIDALSFIRHRRDQRKQLR